MRATERLILRGACVLLGACFVVSSASKILRPYDFFLNVLDYRLFGRDAAVAVAVVTPWIELITGVCLLADVAVAGAMLLSIFMFAAFVIAQSTAIYRSLDINCGCFGNILSETHVSYGTLLRASALLVISIIGYAIQRGVRIGHPATGELVLAKP